MNNPKYNYASPDRYLLLKEFAKKNRNNPTEAEYLLWLHLRDRTLWHKFNRQYIIGDYIVDFVCLKEMLIIEVDGGYHSEYEQYLKDEKRSENLEKLGFRVIRFDNEEILYNIEHVLDIIRSHLYQQVCK